MLEAVLSAESIITLPSNVLSYLQIKHQRYRLIRPLESVVNVWNFVRELVGQCVSGLGLL